MKGFKFGLEAEFLVVRKSDGAPLWHQDLTFSFLNGLLESIPLDGIPAMDGCDLEKPHKKLMPYVVEGYHMHDADGTPIDMKPKGLEIRTPVCTSLDECMSVFETLLKRMQEALAPHDLIAVALSHHPTQSKFEGPQSKRRYDFWQWAMEVMTTFGPDINVSLPPELRERFNRADLEAKIDYYGPSLAALSVAAPFLNGEVWKFRGQQGHSFRMHKRSVIAPPIEIHPGEDWRLEFKVFDMANSTTEFRAQFLCFLGLLLASDLEGRAYHQTRVYDLGQVARHGLKAETVRERLTEFFTKSERALVDWGFDVKPLALFKDRLRTGITPAEEMIREFENSRDLASVLRSRSEFKYENK